MHRNFDHLSRRFNCLIVVGSLVFLGFNRAELGAELIDAVEHTGWIKLRGMIASEGGVFDRLLSWSEFASVDIPLGDQASVAVRETIESLGEHVDPVSVFPPILGMYHGGASNSLDSSNSASSVPPLYAANLASNCALSDPVVLLYWRGQEFQHIPDAPSSGLFRPPRHFLINIAI